MNASTLRRALMALALAPAAALPAHAHAHAHAQTSQDIDDRAREIQLETPTGTLHGTLLKPAPASGPAGAAGAPRAVALIIPGSGPTDRDGNSGALPGDNNSLLMLAEALAGSGIATLRIDKRGVGASASAAGAEADLTFQHYVTDAVGWVGLLRATGDYDRVYIIGHSEGALVATLAAQQTAVDGLVTVAGMGRSLAETVRSQLAGQLPPALMQQVDTILAQIRDTRPVEAVPPMLAGLFRPSVQPYLRSVMDINAAAELARVDVPVLIVQGTTDVQVSVEVDAERLHAARPDAGYVLVEGMNHVLKRVGGPLQQQVSSYGDPTLPIVTELIDAIADFIRR